MSKTADALTCQNKPLLALALFFFAVCLGVHFLVEDTILYAAQSFTEGSSANQIAIDQAEHQDDLVMRVELPQYLPAKDPPVAFRSIKPGERRTCIAISTPPKIA